MDTGAGGRCPRAAPAKQEPAVRSPTRQPPEPPHGALGELGDTGEAQVAQRLGAQRRPRSVALEHVSYAVDVARDVPDLIAQDDRDDAVAMLRQPMRVEREVDVDCAVSERLLHLLEHACPVAGVLALRPWALERVPASWGAVLRKGRGNTVGMSATIACRTQTSQPGR